MKARSRWRLITDPPCSGAWNMALDEVLLNWSARTGACCWRMYGWEEPTLSLGFFQAYHDRREHPPSLECAAVRRLTGGGAILHDAELTYSVVVPGGHPLAAHRDRLYQVVHNGLIEALAGWGVSAVLCREPAPRRPKEEPFLCFRRRAPGDVLVDGTKIAGSAQRRRRGAVLQHGSVLLRASSAAPQLAGLEELTARSIDPGQLTDAWLAIIADQLHGGWDRDPLSQQQRAEALRMLETQYNTSQWTANTPKRVGEAPANHFDSVPRNC